MGIGFESQVRSELKSQPSSLRPHILRAAWINGEVLFIMRNHKNLNKKQTKNIKNKKSPKICFVGNHFLRVLCLFQFFQFEKLSYTEGIYLLYVKKFHKL